MQTLVATTLLMVVVLAVRPFVRRAFGASAAYGLWLIPALRLVVPTVDLFPRVAAPITARPVEIVFAAAAQGPQIGGWLIATWAIGAMIFAAWHVVAYRRFLARVLDGAAHGNGVVVTDAVAGPAAVGLLVRRILLPRDFGERFDAAERDLALRHERVHLSRGDLWANAAALGMLSLHWFNPVAYAAYRAFREDQELSCDAAVIAGAGNETRAAYGRAMVKSAWGAAPFTICPMTRTHNLKRRLKMVRTHRKSVAATVGGAVSVALLALGGLTLTATSGIAGETIASPQIMILKRGTSKEEADAAIGSVIEGRCGNEAQVAETKEKLRAALAASGKPVRTITLDCGNQSKTPAERAAKLERAIAGVSTSNQVNPAERAKIIAALNAELAKAKAGQ